MGRFLCIRQDLSTRLRRSVPQIRQGRPGSSMLLRCRQDRPFVAAYTLWPVAELRLQLLRRIFCPRFADGGRRMPWCDRALSGRRNVASLPCQKHGACHRRLRARLLLLHIRAHLHRGWYCHGLQGQSAQSGSGVCAISSYRYILDI